jgi:hypothetical protein
MTYIRLTVCIALALALLALPAAASAEVESDVFSDPEIGAALLPIAQCVVAESGGHTSDVIAITHVLAKRARQAGISAAEMARRYCRIHRDAARGIERVRPHRRWILELTWHPHQAQPASWPGGQWSQMRDAWRKVQLLVVLVATGELDDPCPDAFHWGGSMDGRPKRTGPVSCGATRNLFWSRPGRTL